MGESYTIVPLEGITFSEGSAVGLNKFKILLKMLVMISSGVT